MADENTEGFDAANDAAQESAYSLREFVRALSAGSAMSEAKLKAFADANGIATHQLQGLAASIKNAKATVSAVGSMAGAIGKGNTNFNVLNQTIGAVTNTIGSLLSMIPLVGGALQGLTVAAGQATNYMIDQYQSAYGAFENLSQVGAAGAQGIEDIRTQFGELGLPIEAMAAIVAKNSQRLAGLSGTVLDASKQFTSTAGAMKQLDDQGNSLDMQLRVLGYSSDEIADAMIQYADLQRRFGAQQTLSNDQLMAGTLAYGKELDAIAKLTGMNRKQLQSEMDQMMLNERFAAKIRDMQLNGQTEAAKELQAAVLAQTAMGNKQMASAIMAAATGFYTTPEAKAAAATIPGFMENVNGLVNGTQKMRGFTQNLQDSAKIAEEQYRGLAMATGNNTVATQMYNEQLNLATRDAGKIGEAIDGAYNAIDQGSQFPEEATKNLAGAKISLENASATISMLATDFKAVASGVKTLAVAIDETVNWIRNTINAKPTQVDTREQQTIAIQQRAQMSDELKAIKEQLQNETDPTRIAELNARLDVLNKSITQLTAGINDYYQRTQPTTGGKAARPAPGSSEPIMPGTPLYDQVKSGERELPKGMYLFEPAPTTAEPVTVGPKTPAATSTNLAEPSVPETQQSLGYGGVATGPRSGYRATLHGTEAVIPLENQKIPVEIKDSRDMKPQIDLMERQIAKLDAVIDAIQKHTAVSEKMFRSNYS
jgi:chromosome segregation ATPase